MHDIRLIRENPEAFDAGLARRGLPPMAQTIKNADQQRRNLKFQLETLRADKKKLSAFYGQLAALGQANTDEALNYKQQSVELARQISELEERERQPSEAEELLKTIPNLPADDVPDGAGEEDNEVKKEWWPENRRVFDFSPKEHADIAPALGMDFETGVRLSGARFTFLRGGMARLHRALGQFMLDVQTGEHGYAECNPPVLVKDEAMYGTDKLPKFAEDSFESLNAYKKLKIRMASLAEIAETFWTNREISHDLIEAIMTEYPPEKITAENAEIYNKFRDVVQKAYDLQVQQGDDLDAEIKDLQTQLERLRDRRQDSSLWLIPTSEVSLTASVMGELLDEAELPLRLTALTLCFRSEAGSHGRDTRGFIRQHQFEKCELVSIVRPEDSEAEHQRMVRAAETILERLALPYRKLLLCTGDMGFGARKTYDLEVWLPGQGAFREISSCSNTGDFQARRMNSRYRVAGEKRTEFVHTLNGSGLAVGRTLVAVIENYQNADGSVTVPEALRPYMGGLELIKPD